MRFLLGQNIIDLADYKLLYQFVNEYTICSHIIDFLDKWNDNTIDVIEFKTSGSTGQPKTVAHLKSSMIVSAKITQKAFDYKEKELALLCLPVQYISGCMMLVRSIVADLDLVISGISTNPFENVDLSVISKIHFAPMTPMQFENAYKTNLRFLNSIDNILLGGASVTDGQKSLIRPMKSNVFVGYGMTETITHLALQKLNNNPDTGYKVLDGFVIEKNEQDCIVIYGNHLPEKIVTNDIVELISRSEFRWKGRADNVINSGGLKINPEKLEDSIGKHLNLNFIITSIEDDILGEKVVIVVESSNLSMDSNKSSFIENLKKIFEIEDLGNRKPRMLTFVDKFKMTESGKLDLIAIKASIDQANLISFSGM